MQSLPTITPKSKPTLRKGIMGHLRHIGSEVIAETAKVPADLAKTAVESVGGKVTPMNTKDVNEYLYGSGKPVEDPNILKQKEATEQQSTDVKLAEERKKLQEIMRFKNDRARMEGPGQQELSIQEQFEREEYQKQEIKAQQAQQQKSMGSGALPQGKQKKGMFGMIKRKRGDFGRMEAGGKGT